MNTTELRLFTDWLAEHLGEHEDQMLTNELLDLMQQVQLTGRSGRDQGRRRRFCPHRRP